MRANLPYKGINQVLSGIRQQIIDSVEWCYNNIPEFNSPKELFYYLRENTTFINDPEGIELLQSAQTLFENNYHGRVGGGDCDCLTVLAVSCFIAQGWGNIDIMLGGRSRVAPVHIWCRVNGENFDLTEPIFNQQRNYPYKQKLKIKFYK